MRSSEMSDELQSGEFVVRNRYGDVVQRGEVITVETPDGIEARTNPPAVLRSAGDSFTCAAPIIRVEDE